VDGSRKVYYIVDFVATRNYYHTHPLIIAISQFLSREGFPPRILLPSNADKIVEIISENIHYNLDNGYSSRTSRPIRHILHKLIAIVYKNPNSGRRIKRHLRRTYIKSATKYFKATQSSKNKHIIFPTLDPLSLELALNLSRNSNISEYFFYFRIIGSESRGILASNSELKSLLSFINLYPKNVRIGVETVGYKSYLENFGYESKHIFWSPWPSLENINSCKSETQRMKIGFLGCAKQRKGFDNIPKILNNLKAGGIEFDSVIQTANFAWAEYEKTLKDIKTIMGGEFKFLSSNLSLTELLENITKCDLLILPYDADSYSINGSGVLYHACDLSVPVITSKGVGFATEVEKFTLGFTYSTLDQILDRVKRINSVNFDFLSYNSERAIANKHFFMQWN
jgi:hypothetical protein